MLKYSETRIIKIEEFVSSQKERITSLEEKLQESEQVCIKMIYYYLLYGFYFMVGQDWPCREAKDCGKWWHNAKSHWRVKSSKPTGKEKIKQGKILKKYFNHDIW